MQGTLKTIDDLKEQLLQLDAQKRDFIVPAKDLTMRDDEIIAVDTVKLKGDWRVNANTHSQLATKLGIPKNYYDRMVAVPGLRSENVNAWLQKSEEKHMVRTLAKDVRAILSDKFKPIDNILIMNAFLPVLKGLGEVSVNAIALTESRLYVQVFFPRIQGEVTKGDIVQSGITLTNSETGQGAVDILTSFWRLRCLNGMVGESIMRRRHVGRKIGESPEDYDVYKSDTIQAELKSFQLRLRDVMAGAVSEAAFANSLIQMKKAAGLEVEDVKATVEEVTRHYSFTDEDGDAILNNLVKEGGTVWNLANAVTALAHSTEDRDKQFEFEKAGDDIVQHATEWKDVAA